MMGCLVNKLNANVNIGAKGAVNNGVTPFYMAAQLGLLPVMRYLVRDLGADVNRARPCGVTPLYNAAKHGLLDVLR
jgi:hypothetical protein